MVDEARVAPHHRRGKLDDFFQEVTKRDRRGHPADYTAQIGHVEVFPRKRTRLIQANQRKRGTVQRPFPQSAHGLNPSQQGTGGQSSFGIQVVYKVIEKTYRTKQKSLFASSWLEFVGHSHQFDQRGGFHLLHDSTAIDFYRDFAQAHLGTDLLVDESSDHQVHDFPFARSQLLKPGT